MFKDPRILAPNPATRDGDISLTGATLPQRSAAIGPRRLSEQAVVFSSLLSDGVSARLNEDLGAAPGQLLVGKFPNSETRIEIHESVRDRHAFVVATMGPSVNDSLFESILLVQALKLADTRRITVVLPYFPYSRQDRKADVRPPISARAVTDMFKAMGAHQIVTVDLHATQVEGFFDGPFENLSGLNQLVRPVLLEEGNNLVAVSPDAGGAKRAENFARQAEKISGQFVPLLVMSKFRPNPTTAPIVTLSADPDVLKNKTCVLVDDMIDTGGSIIAAAKSLKEKGASRVIVCATHAVCSNNAVSKMADATVEHGAAPAIDRIFVTDTLRLNNTNPDLVHVVSVSPLLAEAILRLDQPMGTLRELKERTDLGRPVSAPST